MVEAKRPRGRPRKHPIIAAPQSKTIAPDWTPEQGMAPVLMSQAYQPEPVMLEAITEEPISVVVHFRAAFGNPGIEELVTWPRNWPIPAQGDQVRLGTLVGFVAYVTYDLSDKTLHISTR